jgi:hypothetical protein
MCLLVTGQVGALQRLHDLLAVGGGMSHGAARCSGVIFHTGMCVWPMLVPK